MNKHILLVLIGALSYGILASFAKMAYAQGYVAAEITFAQAAIGALTLWIPAIIKKIRTGNLTSGINWYLLIAGMGMGASVYAYYLSLQYIPVSLAIVLLLQMTWMSTFLEWLIFKRKPIANEIYATVFIIFGTVLAGNLLDMESLQFSLPGIVYVLFSALLYSVYIISTSRLGNSVPMFEKSALMITGSALAILLINFGSLRHSMHFDLGLLKWGSLLALFGAVIPPIMYTKGMPHIGAGLGSILVTMELPVAVLCAHFILNEPVSHTQIAGIVIMLGSVVYLNINKERLGKKERRPKRKSNPSLADLVLEKV